MTRHLILALVGILLLPALSALSTAAPPLIAGQTNLIENGTFAQRGADGRQPAGYQLVGNAECRYLGDPAKDVSGWGIAFQSARSANRDHGVSGSVSQTVNGIDASAGLWFRFTFRGLPQDNFAVADDALFMKVEYLSDQGKNLLDGKSKKIYPIIEKFRRDLTANGDHHADGAATWRTYQLDFWLPFPQIDALCLSVGFDRGSATTPAASEFFITDMSLVRIADPPATETPHRAPTTLPAGNLLPLGGRWFYLARTGETEAPKLFDDANCDRLIYHDSVWSAPFVGNMAAWLRAGDKDSAGKIVIKDQLIKDNVTVTFDATAMIIHTHGVPNHPTGKFPADRTEDDRDPNYIQDRLKTYYIPLNPKENPNHIVTTTDNSNHALPMGPIGIAVNGVVFFNPFDMNSSDASNMMDRCCGHPAPDNTYHYHKYPICLNSPWADDGSEHSPLIGWAFDGFPIYGPYASANLMAKDVKGEYALNGFNMHFDKERGWHYQVTPGKFPYLIGGYWGAEDPRDMMRRPGGGPGGNNGPGNNGPGGNGPGGNGQGNGGPGRRPGGPPPGGGFNGPPPGGDFNGPPGPPR